MLKDQDRIFKTYIIFGRMLTRLKKRGLNNTKDITKKVEIG